MSHLSDEEKYRIREEEMYREQVRRLVPPSSRSLFSTLNSAFVVTLLGSLLVIIVGRWLQDASTRQQMQISHLKALQSHKYELYTSFSTEFTSSVTLLGSLLKLRLNIEIAGGNEERFDSKVGRTIKEAQVLYEELWKRYTESPNLNSLTLSVKVLSDDTDIRQMVEQLDRLVEEMQRSKDVQGIEASVAKMDALLNSLANNMWQEIRHPKDPWFNGN